MKQSFLSDAGNRGVSLKSLAFYMSCLEAPGCVTQPLDKRRFRGSNPSRIISFSGFVNEPVAKITLEAFNAWTQKWEVFAQAVSDSEVALESSTLPECPSLYLWSVMATIVDAEETSRGRWLRGGTARVRAFKGESLLDVFRPKPKRRTIKRPFLQRSLSETYEDSLGQIGNVLHLIDDVKNRTSPARRQNSPA